MRSDDNLLRCPKCGFGVYTQARNRHCARCDTLMVYIKKIEKKRKRNRF
ncbi:hypothetical protein LCGC14_1517710 [marine sediment metagenome]|uniref:Uncharacterized protein n=1 Tax=marine sediment metagenome TaxID=412755 RepID=A0A0F9LFA0_9ZZZZ